MLQCEKTGQKWNGIFCLEGGFSMTKKEQNLEEKLEALHLYIEEEPKTEVMREEEKKELLHTVMDKIAMQKKQIENGTGKNVRTITQKRKKRGIMKKNHTKVAVAVIGILLAGGTITAGARAIYLNSHLADYFRIASPANKKDADKLKDTTKNMVQNLNKTATSNGITLTAKQVIGDDYGCYLLLTVSGIKNKAAEDDLLSTPAFKNLNITIPGKDNLQISDLKCMGLENGVYNYILKIGCENLEGSKITIHAKDFGYQKKKFTSVAKGNWKLQWNVSYSGKTKEYAVNKNINVYGGKAVWDTLSITPLSASISLTMKTKNKIEMSEASANDALYVDFANGKRLNTKYMDAENVYDDTTKISMSFPTITDIDTIVSVTFSGVTYPIHPEKAVAKTTYTNKEMNFSLQLSDELKQVITTPKTENYKDADFNAKGQRVNFIGKKDNTKMTLFTIFRIRGMWSPEEADHKNPMAHYIAYQNGYTYFIQYGEIVEEAQNKAFANLLNKESGIEQFIAFLK